jgi:hypothetical protein
LFRTAIISRWLAAAGAEPDPRRRADLGALALTLAALKDWFAAWNNALKGWNMQESQFVLELQAAANLEARLAAKLEALKAFLEGRFGPLPADMVHRIDAVTDLQRLDQLIRAAGRVSRPEELSL